MGHHSSSRDNVATRDLRTGVAACDSVPAAVYKEACAHHDDGILFRKIEPDLLEARCTDEEGDEIVGEPGAAVTTCEPGAEPPEPVSDAATEQETVEQLHSLFREAKALSRCNMFKALKWLIRRAQDLADLSSGSCRHVALAGNSLKHVCHYQPKHASVHRSHQFRRACVHVHTRSYSDCSLQLTLHQHWKTHLVQTCKGLTNGPFIMDSVVGGAWPFLVDGLKCLVSSVDERDNNQLNDANYDSHLISPQRTLRPARGRLRQWKLFEANRCSDLHAQRTC